MTTFSSCSKDSEDLIVGEWECYKHESRSYESDWRVEESDDDEPILAIWRFYDDGTVEVWSDGGITGWSCWSINGDELELTTMSDFTIEELTSSHMILYRDRGSEYQSREYFKRK